MSRLMPYDSEGLWLKARLFINRAMDDSTEFEEAAFWACCGLELLGKSALSRVSPLLIALPTDDGNSLLIASGAVEDADSFVTVQAKAVWARCGRAFRQFNTNEAKELSLGRNAYIHSAAIGFNVIPPDDWWPRFWALAHVLVAHCGRETEDLVGPTRAAVVQGHLDTNRANMDRRLKSLVENAQLQLRLHQDGSMSGRMKSEWDRFDTPITNWNYRSYVECPACNSDAAVGGDDVLERDVSNPCVDRYGDTEPQVTLTIALEEFACANCRMA
ncbi:hypothetical protein [Microbacterium lacticum]|uniref:hypothetical protein n=1 Tax=Microbacterium lacticum TaxID=33885 RepID=UPI00242FC482|nr:hypothetical protein [Microbacterium lacticum]